MEIEVGRAVLSGIVGTAAMTLAMLMGGLVMGMKMDMPMTLGTMLSPKGSGAWTAGLMMHLGMGIAFFLIYAVLFDGFGISSAIAGWSALLGVIHASIAGVAFGMMPMVHPRMARGADVAAGHVPAPGLMARNMGMMGVVAFFGAHALFGAVAGAVYAA